MGTVGETVGWRARTLITSGAMYSNVPTELMVSPVDWSDSRTRDRPKSVICATIVHSG